mgnify:CR=1 FL=1
MSQSSRPRIALLGRLAEHTSATRREGLVTARLLAESVWQAGGEPLTMLPVADSDWASRLEGIDGVLMPLIAQAARTVGSQVGRQLLRGVLGGLLGGSRRR